MSLTDLTLDAYYGMKRGEAALMERALELADTPAAPGSLLERSKRALGTAAEIVHVGAHAAAGLGLSAATYLAFRNVPDNSGAGDAMILFPVFSTVLGWDGKKESRTLGEAIPEGLKRWGEGLYKGLTGRLGNDGTVYGLRYDRGASRSSVFMVPEIDEFALPAILESADPARYLSEEAGRMTEHRYPFVQPGVLAALSYEGRTKEGVYRGRPTLHAGRMVRTVRGALKTQGVSSNFGPPEAWRLQLNGEEMCPESVYFMKGPLPGHVSRREKGAPLHHGDTLKLGDEATSDVYTYRITQWVPPPGSSPVRVESGQLSAGNAGAYRSTHVYVHG